MHCTGQFFLLQLLEAHLRKDPHTRSPQGMLVASEKQSLWAEVRGCILHLPRDAWVVFRAGAKEHTL